MRISLWCSNGVSDSDTTCESNFPGRAMRCVLTKALFYYELAMVAASDEGREIQEMQKRHGSDIILVC